MVYKWFYRTPDGFDDMVMSSDGEFLTSLVFVGSRDDLRYDCFCRECDLPIFRETCRWLDIYFSGKEPDFVPKYKINNLTSFRQEVIDIMNTISFGETVTYNDIAKVIADKRGIARMSAQAVGSAAHWNPICIIIPCHRVISTSGGLSGYGGGINNKVALLTLEGNDMSNYFI